MANMFFNGEHIGKTLGWMIFIGKTVPDRNTSILGKFLDGVVREATKFNTVKHTPKNESCITDRFFLAKLNIVLTKKFGMHTKVASASDEGTTGAS